MTTDSPTYGKTNSRPFNWNCRPGDRIHHFYGHSGSELDAIGFQCTGDKRQYVTPGTGGHGWYLNVDESGWTGATVRSGRRIDAVNLKTGGGFNSKRIGGTGGGQNPPFNCPKGLYFVGIDGHAEGRTDKLRFHCGVGDYKGIAECCSGKRRDGCRGYSGSGSSGNIPCDSFMKSYCKSYYGINEPICACFNSSIARKLGEPARCVDSKCMIANAYKTDDMIRSNCPDKITCNQINNLSAGEYMNILNTQFRQECGKNAKTEQSTTTTELEQASKIKDIPNVPQEKDNTMLIIVILFIALFLFITISALIIILIW